MKKLPNGYWTKEKCLEEALKYYSKKEFRENNSGAYSSSTRNKWLNEICSHMENRLYKHWTKEKCLEEALKYKTKKEFMKSSWCAYQTSCNNGWLNEVCFHLIGIKRNHWIDKDNCKSEALKYNTLNEFAKNAPGAYKVSSKNGWLNEITSHMSYLGNKYKRCIYCYEFSDNSVYIGLTYNLERRNTQHNSYKNSKVFIHIENTRIIPNLTKLTDYVDVGEAQKMEYYYLNKYKNDGYNILNKAKTGGVGGSVIKWTRERCIEESLKYKTMNEFRKGCNGAYNKCLKEKWNDITTHLEKVNVFQKKGVFWTKERCLEEALKYKTKSEFGKESGSAYSSARKNKWLDEICSHMPDYRLPNGYWTKEKCKEEALNYIDKKSYSKNSNTSYLISHRNGWLDEICLHMEVYSKPKNYWTYERCKEESIGCKNKLAFRTKCASAYNKSKMNNWLNDFFDHSTNYS